MDKKIPGSPFSVSFYSWQLKKDTEKFLIEKKNNNKTQTNDTLFLATGFEFVYNTHHGSFSDLFSIQGNRILVSVPERSSRRENPISLRVWAYG